MSTPVQHHLPHPRFGRLTATWIVVAVLFATGLMTGGLALLVDGDETARGTAPVSGSVGGPDEAARGAAAATAVGGGPALALTPGGPDETARGQAASSAGSR